MKYELLVSGAENLFSIIFQAYTEVDGVRSVHQTDVRGNLTKEEMTSAVNAAMNFIESN